MLRALLTFSILLDHEDKGAEVRGDIKLYREDGQLVWRIGGPLGDEVETLPKPKTVSGAQLDAMKAYPKGYPWYRKDRWED